MRILDNGFVPTALLILLLATLSFSYEVAMNHQKNSGSQEQATRDTINRFNEAFNRHDAGGVEALLTDDTVFEDRSPAPDGGVSRKRKLSGNSGAGGLRGIRMPSSMQRR
jgi:hypothetical protein